MAGGRSLCVLAGGAMLVGSWLVATPAGAEPLALIAAARGHVEVSAAGSTSRSRASFGRALERGDRLFVSAGGSATVLFNDGNVIELAEKSTLTIGGRAGPRTKAAALPGEVYANVTRFVTGGSRETGLVALSSLRAGNDSAPLLIAPRQTELIEGRPTFRWRAVEGAVRYRLVVSGERGVLWEREVAADTLAYPPDAPPLTPGADNLWEIRALSDKGELRREESYVRVLSAEEAEAVRGSLARIGESAGGPGSPATRFLSGSYLCGRGLYRDALAQFEALSRLDPESPAPHEALGNVYRAVGLMDLAAAEYQRALALSRER